MKILRLIVRGTLLALFVGILAILIVVHHYDRGAPAIPQSKALALLNNCDRFIHVGTSTRHAIGISNIRKGGKRAFDGSNIQTVDVHWKWISGPNAPEGEDKAGSAMFGWQTNPGLRDWNFPEGQWTLMRFGQLGDEESFNCTTPTLIR